MRRMKLKPATVLGITVLCVVLGTVAWELIERIGLYFYQAMPSLAVGPYGFDVGVLAVWIRINPGSILALPAAVLLLRRL